MNERVSKSTDLFEVFPWNKNFETGHATIDDQHKKLVQLLNQLARTLVHEEPVRVNQAFSELAEYAEYHFTEEENIWSEFLDAEDYWLASHQISHAAFLPKVIEFKSKESEKTLSNAVEDIVKFLIRWLAFHIIDNDKRMAIAIEEIKAGIEVAEAKATADKKMSGSMRILIETILNMYDGLSSSAMAMMREKNARIKAEKALQEAQAELKILEGILPICAHCKKIRNERGNWDQLESYISDNSQATFSHSVCPACVKKHYPEYKLKSTDL